MEDKITDIQIQNHILQIDASLVELAQFEEKTMSPNPIQHQYIGTIINSISGLLCSAVNSLDKGNRVIVFSEFNNWKSMMQLIHRIFLSMMHAAIELGLIEICKQYKLEPSSSEKRRYLKIIAKINTDEKEALEKIKKHFEGQPISFDDQLEAVFSITNITKDRKKILRKSMEGLRILRNKASHADPSLSSREQKLLEDNGFAKMISEKGELQMNTGLYNEIIKFILQFWGEILPLLKQSNNQMGKP